MRLMFAGAAVAVLVAGCAPEADKTNPAVATEESVAERAASAPAAGATSFTQEQARERATQSGYMDVGALTQNAEGAWQGTAMKDGASVTVVVDYQGNVTAQGGASAPTMEGGATQPAAPSTSAPATTPTTPQ